MRKILHRISLTAIVILSVSAGIFANSQESRVVIENDGWKLVGDLLVPKSKKPLPAIILLNKANGTRKVYQNLARHLAEIGMASLRIDLRAHGDSTNKGKFGEPFDEKMRSLLIGSEKDIAAAFNYLKKVKGIDADRIGLVGASYTGEEMAVAARQNGYAKAYVALSPGSFSEESLNSIDSSQASWLFIKSAEERAQTLKDFFSLVRQKSKTAQTMEVAGNKHATDLLDSTPELAEIIAVWFKYRL